jgi:hypothetical protein
VDAVARDVIVFMALLTSPAALRAIKKNEELLLNYGEDYWTNMMPEEVRRISSTSLNSKKFQVNAEASKALSRDDTSTARPSSNPPLPAAKKSKTAAPASTSALLQPTPPGTSSSAATVLPSSITMIVPEN